MLFAQTELCGGEPKGGTTSGSKSRLFHWKQLMSEALPISQLVIQLGLSDYIIRKTMAVYNIMPEATIPRIGKYPKHRMYKPSTIAKYAKKYSAQAMENWRNAARTRARLKKPKPLTILSLDEQIVALRKNGMKVASIARRLRLDIVKVLEVVNKMEA